MTFRVTDEELGKISRQWNDLFRRVRDGSLDASLVSAGIQGVIEGRYPQGLLIVEAHQEYIHPPAWWRTAEQQLERARQLWPDAVLPELPAEFSPRTKSEVLLLHVPDSFDSLWDKVADPDGYTKCRWESVKTDDWSLRLAPNKCEYTEPVWLAFDPEHGKGAPPDFFWGRADLAASEVFSALIQFPEWPLAWLNDATALNLSGYQLKYDGDWSGVPCVSRWCDDRELELAGLRASRSGAHWSSPSVRKC